MILSGTWVLCQPGAQPPFRVLWTTIPLVRKLHIQMPPEVGIYLGVLFITENMPPCRNIMASVAHEDQPINHKLQPDDKLQYYVNMTHIEFTIAFERAEYIYLGFSLRV